MKYQVEILKCEHKQGNESIKNLHYRANEVLFKLKNQYIMKNRTIRAGRALRDVVDELMALKCTSNQADLKRNELVMKINDALKYLRSVISVTPSAQEMQSTINYEVSAYLRDKTAEDYGISKAFQHLKNFKLLVNDLGGVDAIKSMNLKTSTLSKSLTEIEEIFKKECEIFS